MRRRLVLRRARTLEAGGGSELRDLHVVDGLVVVANAPGGDAGEIDLDGRWLLPALVNAHDLLDLSTLPPLGRPPHDSVYEWSEASEVADSRLAAALSVPLPDRLFLGGIRNLLAGAASVLHHHPYHRSLARDDFPVRVQGRYSFAHSPGLTPALRRTYRTSDRRIPWIVRAAEGRDPGLRREIDALAEANVLRQNTVIVHGTALAPEDAPRLAAAKACVVWCPEADRRLYGCTAPAAALRAGGVRIGLGSDGAHTGTRDALSNLEAARREGAFDDATLVDLATRGSAEVARVPVGGTAPGAIADLVAVGSVERLLGGDRGAIALVLVRGEALYGEPALMAAAGRPTAPLTVDGEGRALHAPLGQRLAGLLRRHADARGAVWLRGVVSSAESAGSRVL